VSIGTFVRIYAGGLTIFSTRATWAELGVPQQSARQLRYRRPPNDLVPREIPEWFRSAAQRARDGLNAVGVEVAFLHPYRWVGYRDWAGWLADFRRTQAEWETYRREREHPMELLHLEHQALGLCHLSRSGES